MKEAHDDRSSNSYSLHLDSYLAFSLLCVGSRGRTQGCCQTQSLSLQVPSDSVLRNIETERKAKDCRLVVITRLKCQSSLTRSVSEEIMCRRDSLDTGIRDKKETDRQHIVVQFVREDFPEMISRAGDVELVEFSPSTPEVLSSIPRNRYNWIQ